MNVQIDDRTNFFIVAMILCFIQYWVYLYMVKVSLRGTLPNHQSRTVADIFVFV